MAAIHFETVQDPPSPKLAETLDLLPKSSGEDKKPDITETRREVPEYAYEGAPGLPGKWTYAVGEPVSPGFLQPIGGSSLNHRSTTYAASLFGSLTRKKEASPEPPVQVTSASLDFVKASVSGGDIPPELGIVHYRLREAKRANKS
jgi:hypothetical protein